MNVTRHIGAGHGHLGLLLLSHMGRIDGSNITLL